jgi:phage baseplate assembly protein W
MSRSGWRAWRFVHPDLDAETSGLQLTPRGGIDLATDDQAVRQSILLLLSTRPGERVMRPEYGCHLQKLVFAPNDDTTAGIAVYYVRRALQQWEPRIDILSLDAARNTDLNNPNQLIITLEYQVRMTQSRETLELSLDLTGG